MSPFKRLTRDDLAARFTADTVAVMLEDGRMGLVTQLQDDVALVDVYRENDHQAQLRVPFGNFVDVAGMGLMVGLKGVNRSEDEALHPPGRQSAPFPPEHRAAIDAMRAGAGPTNEEMLKMVRGEGEE